MSKFKPGEIVPHQKSSIIKAVQPKGFEEPTPKEDLIIPRAKLLQALSPEVSDCKEGCKPGAIVNSLNSEVLPSQFIPLFKYTEYIKFNPMDKSNPAFDLSYAPGALIWRTTDPHDPRVSETEFAADGSKPTALKTLNFLSYFPGSEMPVVISFSKTSYKSGKKLLSLAQFAAVDMYARKYELRSKQQETDGHKYYVLDVFPAGKSTDEEIAFCDNWFTMFRSRPIETDVIKEVNEEA